MFSNKRTESNWSEKQANVWSSKYWFSQKTLLYYKYPAITLRSFSQFISIQVSMSSCPIHQEKRDSIGRENHSDNDVGRQAQGDIIAARVCWRGETLGMDPCLRCGAICRTTVRLRRRRAALRRAPWLTTAWCTSTTFSTYTKIIILA